MSHRPRRSNLVLLLLAWLTLLAVAGGLLITAELRRLEQAFSQATDALAAGVRQKLHANEAVLSGLSAFLLAVEHDDRSATERYAAAVIAAHPHIHQIEIACRVPAAEAEQLAETLRRSGLGDFTLKDFSALTGRPTGALPAQDNTWPIVFIYPDLPETRAIHGLRLETVDHLATTLARARGNPDAVASRVFPLYQGETGYLLLRVVEHPASLDTGRAPGLFGNTISSMLLIKSAALMPAEMVAGGSMPLGIEATLVGSDGAQGLLLQRDRDPGSWLDRLLLPTFERNETVRSAAQQVRIRFSQQQRLQDVLSAATMALFGLLVAAAVLAPCLLLRHYHALTRASVEHEHSAYLATHDVLTGLPNRYLLADRFSHAVHSWQRNGTRFAVILIDLDHFKAVNDQHGHEAGDQVLRAAAERMSDQLRSCDTVARYGGDEFIVLLTNVLDGDDARQVGEKLLAAVSRPVTTLAGELPLSCSVGIALCPDHGTDLDTLRRRADLAMYSAKQAGRRAVVLSPVTHG